MTQVSNNKTFKIYKAISGYFTVEFTVKGQSAKRRIPIGLTFSDVDSARDRYLSKGYKDITNPIELGLWAIPSKQLLK